MKYLFVFIILILLIILLDMFRVINIPFYSSLQTSNISEKQKEKENYISGLDTMDKRYEHNKDMVNYQEMSSYTQKTNHYDFMYKDFTMALPPDFNQNKCPKLEDPTPNMKDTFAKF